MIIKKKRVEQAMLQFQNDLLQTSLEQYKELLKLQKENEQLSKTDDIQRKTIKKLRTIINQLIIGIGYSGDPKLNRLVENLVKEYGPFFLGLED